MNTAYNANIMSYYGYNAEYPVKALKNNLQKAIVRDLNMQIIVYSCVLTDILLPCQNNNLLKWLN